MRPERPIPDEQKPSFRISLQDFRYSSNKVFKTFLPNQSAYGPNQDRIRVNLQLFFQSRFFEILAELIEFDAIISTVSSSKMDYAE